MSPRFRSFAILVSASVLCLALAACPGGGGGGGGGGGTTAHGPNTDRTSWGSWLIMGNYEWYLSDAHLIWMQPSAPGTLYWHYKIDKIEGASISVIYERVESKDGAGLPTAAPRDLSFTLTKINAGLMRSPVVTATTASTASRSYYLVKSAGAEASVSGLAASGSPGSRALVGAAGISLTIQNVLNSMDTQTVTASEAPATAGQFAVQNVIPDSQYTLTFTGTSKPPIPLTVGYDGQNLGIAADPGTKTYTLKHQGEFGTAWANSSAQRALPYFYVGESGDGISTEVRISGSGPTATGWTGWAEWKFSYDDVPLGSSRYFELPHSSGTMHDSMQTTIPADFVSMADLASGEDYVAREIELGAWVRSTSAAYDTRIWQDSLWLRFYSSSFQLGSVSDSGSSFSAYPSALLILPDLRSFPFGLEFGNPGFATDTRVPVMAGSYYLVLTWSGSGTDSYTFGPGLTFSAVSQTSDLGLPVVDESGLSNDTKATATKLDYGQLFRGTLSSSDPVDYLYFAAKP